MLPPQTPASLVLTAHLPQQRGLQSQGTFISMSYSTFSPAPKPHPTPTSLHLLPRPPGPSSQYFLSWKNNLTNSFTWCVLVYCCCTCGDQRTTSNNHLSPSTMWALEMGFRFVGLGEPPRQLSQTFLPTVLSCPTFLSLGFRLPSAMLSLSIRVPKRLETSICFNKLSSALWLPAACLVPSMTSLYGITLVLTHEAPLRLCHLPTCSPSFTEHPSCPWGKERT